MSKVIQARLNKLKEADWESDEEVDTEENKIELEKPVSFAPKKAAATLKKAAKEASRVIYLGRIPHGFYENEMLGFFKQFGEVTRLRLSRNKKSGNSKHFAFIEFELPRVAEIVCETMQGYRLFDHTLQCNIVPVEKMHESLFSGCNKKFRTIPWQQKAVQQHNKVRTLEEQQRTLRKLLKKEKAKRQRFEKLGIDYEFGGYEACVPQAPAKLKF